MGQPPPGNDILFNKKQKNVIKKLPQPQLLHQLEVPALALVEAQLRRRQGGAVGRPRNQ